MRAYFGLNMAKCFEDILEDIWYDPEFVVSPRGYEVREIRDCCIEVENPMENIYINKYRSSQLKYCAAELLWYFSGTNNPAFIENYASMWKNLHNEDGTVNSSYGNLLFSEKNEHNFTQYQWVIETLKKDKDSRQAFMHFNKPKHQFLENKDQVCTLQTLFHIRNNSLYMTTSMRSNDLVYGFFTDFTFFSILQYHVFLQLKQYYSDLKIGYYTHVSHSMHVYQKHYDLIKNMVTDNLHCEPYSLPLLTETILEENGNIIEKYKNIFEPIKNGNKPDYTQKTDNDLINWCFKQLI